MSNGTVLPEIVVTPTPTLTPQQAQAQAGSDLAFAGPPDATNPYQFVYPTRPANTTKAYDQATIIVRGLEFEDWESVWVRLEWGGAFSYFRFTAVERDTPPGLFQVVQFVPGDNCQILLGGVPLINGYIEQRQVAYDATRHGVELQGKSATAPVARSSVNTQTGNFDNMTWQQVAEKVLSPFPTGLKIIGALDQTPFVKLQNQPGEQIWDFLERLARVRGIILGSDSFGNFVAIGDHSFPVLNPQLIEGQNIKKCQCVIKSEHAYNQYDVTAQTAASDDQNGTAASQLQAGVGGTGYLNSILITPAEQPVKSIAEVLARAKFEWLWHEGTKIELTITVQGWFRDDQNLWWPGDDVLVYSPMIPMNMVMKIENVIFTQDNASGTETTLELKQPWALKDTGIFNVSPIDPNTQPQQVVPGQGVQPIPD